jgi:hypothetical protein
MNGPHQFPDRTRKLGLAVVSAVLFCGGTSKALEPSDPPAPADQRQEVGDFSLLDQNGRFHQLRRQHGARAVVLMIAGTGCPIVRQNLAAIGTKDWKVFYRGAIDDQMVQGAVKAKASESYLDEALQDGLRARSAFPKPVEVLADERDR